MAVPQTGLQTKGERTRAAILGEALRLVSKAGLDGLTIGTLAEATGMSKSGLFAHFGSREELLLAVRQAVEEEQLAKDTDPEQIAFEMFGIALVVHHHRRLLGYKKARERALAALDSLFNRNSVS